MPRPCHLRHPTPVPDGCGNCRLYRDNPRVRERWDRPDKGVAAAYAPAERRPGRAEPVGSELKLLLATLGLTAKAACGCDSLAGRMNEWGARGCLEREAEIVAHLRDRQRELGWADLLAAGTRAVTARVAFRLNPLDPAPGLLHEAVRRARTRFGPGTETWTAGRGRAPVGADPGAHADLRLVKVPRPGSRLCVLTLAAGEYGEQMLSVSEPLLRAYAGRVGADFRVVRPPATAYPLAWKFAVPNFLEVYDRVCFIDADCVVRPACPDLFALVPADRLGVYDDLPTVRAVTRARPGEPAWVTAEMAKVAAPLGLDTPTETYWNTGVVVASRGHAAAWTPPDRPVPRFHCAEQHLFDLRVHQFGVPVHPLPRELNCEQWMAEPGTPEWAAAHVWHFSGMSDRAKRLAGMRKAVAEA